MQRFKYTSWEFMKDMRFWVHVRNRSGVSHTFTLVINTKYLNSFYCPIWLFSWCITYTVYDIHYLIRNTLCDYHAIPNAQEELKYITILPNKLCDITYDMSQNCQTCLFLKAPTRGIIIAWSPYKILPTVFCIFYPNEFQMTDILRYQS